MGKQKLKPEALREACIAEALRIIGESGLEKLSLREVARRLGVSHQAPYKHFASRDHILAEAMRRAYVAFAAHLDARPRGRTAAEDLGSMGRAYLEYARTNPLHYRLMFETPLPDPAEHPETMRQARHAFGLLRDAIGRLPAERGEAEPEMEALFIWSTLHGLASIQRSHAAETLELPGGEMEFVLRRIGRALGLETPDAGATK